MADIHVLDVILIAMMITAFCFELRADQCVKGTRAQYLAASWHITLSGLIVIIAILRTFQNIKEGHNVDVAFGCLAAMIWTYLTTKSYLNHDNWYKDSFTKLKKGFKRLQEQWLPRPAVA